MANDIRALVIGVEMIFLTIRRIILLAQAWALGLSIKRALMLGCRRGQPVYSHQGAPISRYHLGANYFVMYFNKNKGSYNPSNIFCRRHWSKYVTRCSQNWGISDDTPQFSSFGIYIHTFSFPSELIAKMNRTEHFE